MASTYSDPYPGRKGSERIVETCGRCGGSGFYNAPSRITWTRDRELGQQPYCFQCGGSGNVSTLVSSLRARARREARAAELRAAEREAQLAARAQWENDGYGDLLRSVVDVIESLRDGDPIRRQAQSARERIASYSATQEDADAVLAVLAALQARFEARRPAPEGRVEVEGEIVSTKYVESDFGGAFKMLVEGPGWKVWGTVPRGLGDELGREELDGDPVGLRGRRVAFTATFERSADDEAFGFYKRPTKARLI